MISPLAILAGLVLAIMIWQFLAKIKGDKHHIFRGLLATAIAVIMVVDVLYVILTTERNWDGWWKHLLIAIPGVIAILMMSWTGVQKWAFPNIKNRHGGWARIATYLFVASWITSRFMR